VKLLREEAPAPRAGFTLAEVAVTIAIVAISVTTALRVLNGSKLTAAHVRNQRIARELGLYTLGQINSGLYWDEIERGGLSGSYADLGHEDFYFEVVVGDEALPNTEERDPELTAFDSWAYDRELQYEDEDYDEEAAQPYEMVKLRVIFPQLRDFPNSIDMERWMRWEQVYGEEEEAETSDSSGSGDIGELGDEGG